MTGFEYNVDSNTKNSLNFGEKQNIVILATIRKLRPDIKISGVEDILDFSLSNGQMVFRVDSYLKKRNGSNTFMVKLVKGSEEEKNIYKAISSRENLNPDIRVVVIESTSRIDEILGKKNKNENNNLSLS